MEDDGRTLYMRRMQFGRALDGLRPHYQYCMGAADPLPSRISPTLACVGLGLGDRTKRQVSTRAAVGLIVHSRASHSRRTYTRGDGLGTYGTLYHRQI